MRTIAANVGLILAPTFRSRAYAQMLAHRGIRPALVIYLPGVEPVWSGEVECQVKLRDGDPPFRFRPGIPAQETASAECWTAITLPDTDINSDVSINIIKMLAIDILIYSGLPKTLLKAPLLATGKSFLHVHGGYVPEYRGSTAFYFSLLHRGQMGASAIWIDDKIDTGPVIRREYYVADPSVEVDQVMDPVIRADLLARVLTDYGRESQFPSTTQSERGEVFYVIHPVLKHVAIRALRESAIPRAI